MIYWRASKGVRNVMDCMSLSPQHETDSVYKNIRYAKREIAHKLYSYHIDVNYDSELVKVISKEAPYKRIAVSSLRVTNYLNKTEIYVYYDVETIDAEHLISRYGSMNTIDISDMKKKTDKSIFNRAIQEFKDRNYFI